MRIFFDTEFIEDGHTIEPLSIGMVREDGREYYAEVAETDRSKAVPWVAHNVLPYLGGPVLPRSTIRTQIMEFAGPNPMFWAWYASYDWVLLCQLFGAMLALPAHWPMFVHDVRQDLREADLAPHSIQDGHQHHALSDARWLARAVHHHEAQQDRV